MSSPATSSPSTSSVLLPTNVKPIKYTIELTPSFVSFTFTGSNEIDLEVVAPTTTIVLHAAELEIHSAVLRTTCATSGEKLELAASSLTLLESEQRLVVSFDREIAVGRAVLLLRFTGTLNDSLAGFYRSSYKLPDGTERWMATTQFEATDARKCIPCWDEPAIKAIFQVSLIYPSDRIAISNMPAIEEIDVEPVDGVPCKRVTFAETPIMSTYLLAFIIGDFDYVEGECSNGLAEGAVDPSGAIQNNTVRVRVYTPKGKQEQGLLPLRVIMQSMPYYAKYFGFAYPLPKIDLLAIPDFAAGAMENWGAITYREARLLIDEKRSTAYMKQANLRTINHELAHQWFGNLVTMQWWTHLWLNEGFARYMEHIAVDTFYPEYEIWKQFVFEVYRSALQLDSLKSSHAIEVEVSHPSEINEIFDSISYAKGASIIRMIATFIGEAAFRQGLNQYLASHLYGNAVTEDLWAALSASANIDVSNMMRSWTKQVGFPVVFVKVEYNDTGATIHLSQHRFQCNDGSLWHIPITVETQSGKTASSVFQTATSSITIDGVTSGEWIKLNSNQTGFYRVNYLDRERWSLLGEAARDGTLNAVDRLGALDDLNAMVGADLQRTSTFLSMVELYRGEQDYSVFSCLVVALQKLLHVFDSTPAFPALQSYVRDVFRPTMKRLGWRPTESDTHLSNMLRSSVISLMGYANDTETHQAALQIFTNNEQVTADLRFPVMKMAVESGGVQEWEAVLARFRSSDFSEEQRQCLRALGYSRDPELLDKTLQLAISGEVRSQDISFVVASVAVNPLGRQRVWDWFKSNFDEIIRRYAGGQNFILAAVIEDCTRFWTERAKALEIREFFATHPVPSATRSIEQSLETIEAIANWKERDSDDVATWLASLQAKE